MDNKLNIDILVDTPDKENNKLDIFKQLALLTYEQYSHTLENVKIVFENSETKINNWRQLINKTFKSKDKLSNIGREIENALVNYAIDKGINNSFQPNTNISDIQIGNKLIEVKSSGTSIINTKLQTKFYQKDQLYAFVINTKLDDICVFIISGELLYEISLGEELTESLNSEDKTKFIDQIEEGLKKIDFKEIILRAFLEKKDLNTPTLDKSFKIGNQTRIRFTLNIESHSGSDRKTNK
jgi:hypothetical protein